jgi:putative N6-adenine-specific DNA methylase
MARDARRLMARDARADAPPLAFAIAAPGLAPYVAAELAGLGLEPLAVEPAGVAFTGTAEALLRANCHARLASRVVLRLATFEARDFATLEREARRVPWGRVLAADCTAALSVTCRKSRLYHSEAVAERVGRAIALAVPGAEAEVAAAEGEDALDETHSQRRVQRVLVRFERDRCTISADASGALLHRRGWRLESGKAPLRETLAAALLVASGWPADVPLVDPMCGAGTIAIEAALRVRCIAPGLSRTFACEQWPGADAALAARVRAEARAAVRPSAPAAIVAADRDTGAIAATTANAERAGVLADLTIVQRPLSDTTLADLGAQGWLVTNPPYGIRTGNPATLAALWGRLGAVVRAGGPGWTLASVVPDPALARELRLPLETVLTTTTGGRPIAFVRSRARQAALLPMRQRSEQ